MKFVLLFILAFTSTVYAQRSQTITADCLRIQDGACVDKNELGYLNGVTSNIQTQIDDATTDTQTQLDGKVDIDGDVSMSGLKTFTGKLQVTSTVNTSHPCPSMTDAQMLATSPSNGDCVHNTTLDTLMKYSTTEAAWEEMGGAGGVSQWVTANDYDTNDVVVQSNKLYIALADHTSGTFATDLAGGKWQMLNAKVDLATDATGVLAMANGGTDKALTSTLGGVVYTDANSMEVLAAGTSNQVLRSNGAAAPTWSNRSISAKAENQSSVTLEELQTPNNLLTQTDTNKYLNETGNKNILINPDFEHSTADTGWTNNGSEVGVAESTVVINGKKSLIFNPSSETINLVQSSTLYQAQFADGVQGIASIRIKSSVALTVCSVQAGTVSTSSCVTTSTDSKWNTYKIPFVLGATSNGISIASSGSVTGTVYVDDAFVGAVDVTGQTTVDTAWEDCGLVAADFTGFGTPSSISIQCKRMGSDLLLKGKFTTGTTTATEARVALKFRGATLTSAGTSIIPNIQLAGPAVGSGFSATAFGVYTLIEPSVAYFTLGAQSSTASGLTKINGSAFGAGTVVSINSRIPIAGWSANSDYYSASCGAACVDHFSAKVSAAGTVSDENAEFVTGNCSLSTNIFTCTLAGFTVAPNCQVTAREDGSATARVGHIRALTSSSLVFIGFATNTLAANANSYVISCDKTGADFTATRTIVGSFKEVMTSPGVTKPKKCSAFYAGASDTTACTGTCTEYSDTCGSATGARSGTGAYAITFANGTFAANTYIDCGGTTNNRSVTAGTSKADANGSAVIQVFSVNSSFVASDGYFSGWCEGQAP